IALGVLLFTTGTHALATAGGAGAGRFEYAKVQAIGILHYLRLALWPSSLVFDYGWPRPASDLDWIAAGAFVLALGGATAGLLPRGKPLVSLGAWFCLILAPTSSFMPIATQLLAEHRMSLPLAAVLACVALLLARLPRPAGWAALALTIAALGWRTI